MPEPGVSLLTLWLLGVSMGLTACTVTCLPFIGTWTLGRASGQREAFVHVGVFLGGRVLAYASLAALAGAAGGGLARLLAGNLGNLVIGSVAVGAGLWLALRPGGCRPPASGAPAPVRFQRRRDSLPPLFFGAALTLTPCVPLTSLLALAAQGGSALHGLAAGLVFGLGAAMTPLLVLVPLAGRLGRELRAGRAWLTRWLNLGAAAVLVLLGLQRIGTAL